jgi:hypothetical protein
MSGFRTQSVLRGLALGSALALVTGCLTDDDGPDLAVDTGSVIIGNNDLLPVAADGNNVPARYRGLLDAFGRLLIPSGGGYALCSATHIGNGLVVTAGHCFGAGPTRVDNASCNGTVVEWGYRTGRTPARSNCQSILAMQNGGNRDYAILRVASPPAAAVGVDLSTPPAGTPLTIFSHPGGRPLEWSRTCSLLGPGNGQFGYQCDTQGGSSGAAVLRDDTLQVVGIHWGGGGDRNAATYLGVTAPDVLSPGNPIRPVVAQNRCIDIDGWGQANGTRVILWDCHGGANQRFTHTGGQLRVYGSKCLDVDSGRDVNGGVVHLWDCQSGNGNQQWVRVEDRWQWAGHNKCLDVTEGQFTNGTRIQIWDCTPGNNNQRWN